MTERQVKHATFKLDRTYETSTDRVFAAWADPAAKARWFAGPDAQHELDFRVGGRELNHSRTDGNNLTFESLYCDIVPGQRIVYSSTLSIAATVSTVSLTTVEFTPVDDGTRLLLTEQAAYLDGLEQPSWREHGTGAWLDALGAELRDQPIA